MEGENTKGKWMRELSEWSEKVKIKSVVRKFSERVQKNAANGGENGVRKWRDKV